MERLLDERSSASGLKNDLDEARRDLSLVQQRNREMERELGNARADATRWKALVPPEVLQKAEQATDEVPF